MRLLTTCTGCGESRILANVTGDQLETFLLAHDHPTGCITVRMIHRVATAA